jgi:hypothetical protein
MCNINSYYYVCFWTICEIGGFHGGDYEECLVFWGVAPCGSCGGRRFGGAWGLRRRGGLGWRGRGGVGGYWGPTRGRGESDVSVAGGCLRGSWLAGSGRPGGWGRCVPPGRWFLWGPRGAAPGGRSSSFLHFISYFLFFFQCCILCDIYI